MAGAWRHRSVDRVLRGYVGVNDGWTDLADNYRLDWRYEAALDGNIALTGGLDLSRGAEFTEAGGAHGRPLGAKRR